MNRVVVSGATGGIGRALISSLSARGYELLALGRSPAELEGLLGLGRSISTLEVDLAGNNITQATQRALDKLGWSELFALVNLAALSFGGSVTEVSLEDWQTSLQVNLTAPMLLTQVCAPRMTGARGGVIINVSSPVAHVGSRKASYAATKAALHGLTMSSAKTLGPKNIRVNTLLPGPTLTKMTQDWPLERQALIARETFLGRLSEPQEVADMICCLLSDDARYMTGALVDLTAGSLWGG